MQQKKAMEWAETASASADSIVQLVQENVRMTREKLQTQALKFLILSDAFATSLHQAADSLSESNTEKQTELFKLKPALFVKNKCDKALAEVANANATLEKGVQLLSIFNVSAFGCLNGITEAVDGAMNVVNNTAKAGIAAANLLPNRIKDKAVHAIENLLGVVAELRDKTDPTLKLVEKKMLVQVGVLRALHVSMNGLTERTKRICGEASSQVAAATPPDEDAAAAAPPAGTTEPAGAANEDAGTAAAPAGHAPAVDVTDTVDRVVEVSKKNNPSNSNK